MPTLISRLALAASVVGTVSAVSVSTLAQRNPADLTALLVEGANCVVSGSETWSRLYEESGSVSVAKQLLTSEFYLTAQENEFVLLTCGADSSRFDTLSLNIGISDTPVETLMTINIYHSGNVVHTYSNVGPGNQMDTLLDLQSAELANPQSVAIEMLCHDARARNFPCALHFIDATLHPSPEYLESL